MELPELNEDIAAEILLRIPPDERADLIRASVVCKPWLHMVSDPVFLRGYNAFHRREGVEDFFVSRSVTRHTYRIEIEVKSGKVTQTQVGEPRNYRCATPSLAILSPDRAHIEWTKSSLPPPN